MSGKGIGDAVTESEGEEDVEQSAAEPTLQQLLQRAVATGAKSRVPGAHRDRWEDLNFQRQLVRFWEGAANHHGLQVDQRHRRHERRI